MPTTTLYRAFDKDGVLLYVGISAQVITRFDQHKDSAKWITECCQIKLEHYLTRQLAMKAEVVAIKKEKPIFNIMHKEE